MTSHSAERPMPDLSFIEITNNSVLTDCDPTDQELRQWVEDQIPLEFQNQRVYAEGCFMFDDSESQAFRSCLLSHTPYMLIKYSNPPHLVEASLLKPWVET